MTRQSCGHLWQARFFSCPLDEAHLWYAMAYVEQNPFRAGLAREAPEYEWSSAKAHVNGTDGEGILELGPWFAQYTPERWFEVLVTSVRDEALNERLREAILRGRPLGTDRFINELERKTLRQLRPRTVGRPKKERYELRAASADQLRLLEIGI